MAHAQLARAAVESVQAVVLVLAAAVVDVVAEQVAAVLLALAVAVEVADAVVVEEVVEVEVAAVDVVEVDLDVAIVGERWERNWPDDVDDEYTKLMLMPLYHFFASPALV